MVLLQAVSCQKVILAIHETTSFQRLVKPNELGKRSAVRPLAGDTLKSLDQGGSFRLRVSYQETTLVVGSKGLKLC